MKTKEELNKLKEEWEALNKKLCELSEEELSQIAGGVEDLLSEVQACRSDVGSVQTYRKDIGSDKNAKVIFD